MSGSAHPSCPPRLGQYEIVCRLGAGGMAEVFLAKKRGAEGTYKLLVVKRVLPIYGQARRFRTMFVAEAQLATRLNHPNIVQVYDFQDIGEEGQLLSMEYVEGPNLGVLLEAGRRGRGRVPPWVAAYVIAEAARGLHYAHERRDEAGQPLCIVHRDVSPQNILLSYDGAVKIADFGIASANLFRDEEVGVLKGKFGYMSPEQARAQPVDRRSDIYSLGVCLYELLAGRPLHGALSGDELLEAVGAGEVEPPSTYARDVPVELEAIALRALSKSRDDRYDTARDMAAAIGRALLAHQQLVDASSVEATIAQLVGRGSEGVQTVREGAASASARPGPGSWGHASQPAPEPGPADDGGARGGGRAAREVRHVAAVALRLEGLSELEAEQGSSRAAYALDRLRQTIDDIAYKHGSAWSWLSPEDARAVVGLLANSPGSAVEAAWLAVDVHEALAGFSGDLPAPVVASIGMVRAVALGEREPDGRLVHWVLDEASERLLERVARQTPAASTWVAGGLYRLARRPFRWADVPPLPAEGASPVRLYALERPLSRDERLAEMALAPSELVGRDPERAELWAALHEALAGGHVVGRAVVGEMGIGKTALVGTFLAELPPGARIVRVELSAPRAELPFALVGDVVRDVLGLESRAVRSEIEEALGAVLGPLAEGPDGERAVRYLADVASGVAPGGADEDETVRARGVGAGLWRLFGSLDPSPALVVVCEGLQWCDEPSLRLLSRLVTHPEPMPALVLLVTRPEERVLGRLGGLVRIELGGLAPDDQVRLVEARLGTDEGTAGVCAELAPRVAGNPFFLLEMVDALLERGALALREAGGGRTALVSVDRPGEARAALPSTLEEIVGERLRELPPAEREAVDWLAVAGRPLGPVHIEALAGPEAAEAIVRLCARGLCDRRGEVVEFRHSISRDVAYAAFEPGRRRKMHRRVGALLAAEPSCRGLGAVTAARHFELGGEGAIAAGLYVEAADAARAGRQGPLALRYYRRVVELAPETDVRRLRAHASLESIYRELGRPRERSLHLKQLRQAARRLGGARPAALALSASSRYVLDAGGEPGRALGLARGAVESARLARDPGLELEGLVLTAECLQKLGDPAGALEAFDVARGVGAAPPASRAEALRARGVLLRCVGRVEEAIASHAEAIALCRRAGARRQEARVRNSLAFAVLVAGRWEDAIALALSSIRLDLSLGARFQVAKTLANVGQAYARLGDLPRALAYLQRAREAHERYADRDAQVDTLLVSAEVLLDAGDVAGAEAFCDRAEEIAPADGDVYDLLHAGLVRALLARARGDAGAAVAVASRVRARAEASGLVAFYAYATAIEAASRVERGDAHGGVLLAASALGTVEHAAVEYGLEARALVSEAFERARSLRAGEVRSKAAEYARVLGEGVRDARLRRLYYARRVVADLVGGGAQTGRPSSAGSMP
jgi:eukaryotic-like serine/threonine-protein kinase